MDIHIGQEIKKTAKSNGIGATMLAKLTSKTRANVNHLFTRKTIDVGMLYAISRILKFDFFSLYSEELKVEIGLEHAVSSENDKQRLEMQTNNSVMQQKYIKLLEEKVASLERQLEGKEPTKPVSLQS